MSEKEVIEAFGPPQSRQEYKDGVALHYLFDPISPLKEGNEYKAGFIIYISGGQAFQWDFIPVYTSGPR